jgi:hypothetical protein
LSPPDHPAITSRHHGEPGLDAGIALDDEVEVVVLELRKAPRLATLRVRPARSKRSAIPGRPPSRPHGSTSRPSQRRLGSRRRPIRLSLKLMRSVRVAWPLNPAVEFGMKVPLCCTGKTTPVSATTFPLWNTSRPSAVSTAEVDRHSECELKEAAWSTPGNEGLQSWNAALVRRHRQTLRTPLACESRANCLPRRGTNAGTVKPGRPHKRDRSRPGRAEQTVVFAQRLRCPNGRQGTSIFNRTRSVGG